MGQYEKRNKLSVHPGEERGEDWRRARDTVRAKNFAKDSDEEEHFNIEWFLKMTTGLRPADLWERIKRKAEVRGSTIGEGGDTTISSPGRSPKQPLPGIRLHDPLHGRQACPQVIAFDQGVGQICPR